MNDEDDEFVDLFDGDICYIDGGNQSGFYLVEEQVFETRLVSDFFQKNQKIFENFVPELRNYQTVQNVTWKLVLQFLPKKFTSYQIDHARSKVQKCQTIPKV